MTRLALFLRKLPLALLVIATCATIASSSDRERRHVEESSHRSGKGHVTDSSGKLPSSTSNNEITAEPGGKKVSHRLIGGHLRLDSKPRNNEDDDDDDDDDYDDSVEWDDGILMLAAGEASKEGKNTRGGGGDDEDERKTLSQQVKEGKYGLIQNEIYGDQPKRPGIISYASNPEVPKDTIDNLGGLDEDEIWLAENHVLVLRGGKFPEHASEQDGSQEPSDNNKPRWPPIDDYKAPRRQVKIPARPKVPPPFPVQLTDDGPIQIIGPNGTAEDIANGTLDYSTDPFYTKGLLPGEGPFFPIALNGTLPTPVTPPRNFTIEDKSSRDNNERNKGLRPETRLPEGGPPPFYHALPPGAVFVPPPSNQSDYDEEDQSIYYPPPYSFHYPRDNTTAVPPGPLVPGIILPPPPDFFSTLDEKKTTTTKKYTKRPVTTTPRPPRPTYLPPRKLTTKRYKNPSDTPIPTRKTISSISSSISTKISFGHMTRNATDIFASRGTTPTVEVTTVKPHTLENTEVYTISPVIGNQVSETTQRKDWSTLVTNKVPVLTYYPSTTQSSLERPVEVTPASIKSIITTSQPGDGRSANHASYYFYEESSDDSSGSTGAVTPSSAYHETTTVRSPYYNVETSRVQQTPEQKKKHYYTVDTIAPVETPSDYKVKLIDSIVKNSQTFHYDDAEMTSSKLADGTSARDQSQRMLADEPPVYYPPARPNHSLYYTTPKPQTYYRPSVKPKPVYQYSFQVADYSKRGGSRQTSYREEQLQLRQQQQDVSYGESYQDVQSGTRQYVHEDIDPSREHHQQPPQLKHVSYNKARHRPVYPVSTSGYPIVDTTTANPQHAYFTQQDERLLDDVTKEYFTIFGKKLSGIQSTTPIYGKSSSTTEKPFNTYVSTNVYKTDRPIASHKTPNVKVHYGDQSQRPYSLKDDTLVNYQRPLPPINPDSEFIEPKPRPAATPLSDYELRTGDYRLRNHGPTSRYGTVQPTNGNTNNFVPLAESREELDNVEGSLLDDIEVNYREPRPTVNPDAEFIDPTNVRGQNNQPDNPNAYFAYRLPGDVGHFYFLTPQAITQRQDQNQDDAGYVYSKPRGPRLLTRRRRRRGDA